MDEIQMPPTPVEQEYWTMYFDGSLMKTLLTSDPYAMLFCCNNKIWLQQGVLSQPFALSVALDEIFATQIVSWP
jgi:hypothetical protein